MKNLGTKEKSANKLNKIWNYLPLELKLPEGINDPAEMKLSMYKSYNLDINTRLLQSASPAVTLL